MVHESDTSLNINDRIQALVIAPLDTSYDVIIVGTTSCILAYDFQRNSSLFQRDIVDGINCIKVTLYFVLSTNQNFSTKIFSKDGFF